MKFALKRAATAVVDSEPHPHEVQAPANHTPANHTPSNHTPSIQIPANQVPSIQEPASQVPAKQDQLVDARRIDEDHELGTVSPFRSTLLMVLGVDLLALLLWRAWSNPGAGGINRLLLVLVGTIPVAVVAATKPLTRRLVLRSLLKRKSQSVLLGICGLLATTALTASWQLDAGYKTSANDAAAATLGPVDELIFTSSAVDRARVQQLITETITSTELTLSSPAPNGWTRRIDGQLSFVSAPVLLEQGAQTLRATAIELDPVNASSFGGVPADTGFAGAVALDGKALLLGADTAAQFPIDRTKPVRFSVGGGSLDLRISGILERRGLAALSLYGDARPLVVFVAPGTLVAIAVEPNTLTYGLAISNKGGLREGLRSSSAVTNGLNDLLLSPSPTANSKGVAGAATGTTTDGITENGSTENGSTGVGFTDDGITDDDKSPEGAASNSLVNASVVAAKQNLMNNANKVNLPLLRLVRLLTTLLSFAVGAVLVASCLAFAWARQSEVTTLRALGFARSDLLGFFAVEAWILSAISAFLGALLGSFFAWFAFPAGASFRGTGFSDLAPKISRIAGVSGFAAGFTAMLLTVTAASAGASLGTVANGARKRFGVPRDKHRAVSLRRVIVVFVSLAPLALFGLWTLVHGISSLSPFPLLFALGLFALVVFAGFRTIAPTFPARILIAAFVGFASFAVPFAWARVFKRMDTGSVLMQLLLLAAAGVALLSSWGTNPTKRAKPAKGSTSAVGPATVEPSVYDYEPEETGSGASNSRHVTVGGTENHGGLQAVLMGLRGRLSSMVNEPVEEGQRMVPRELLPEQRDSSILPGSDFVLLRRRGSKVVRRVISSAFLRRPLSRSNGVRCIVSLLTASVLSIVLLRSSLAAAVPGPSSTGGWAGVIVPPNNALLAEGKSVVARFGASAAVSVLGVSGSIGPKPLVGAQISVIDFSFVEAAPPSLDDRLRALPDSQSVWDRVVSGDGVVVAADALADGTPTPNRVRVGDSVSLVDGATGRSISSPVLGVARALPGLGTVVAGSRIAEALFGTIPPQNRLFVRSQPDHRLDVVALSRELSDQGLRYESLFGRLQSSSASLRRTLGLLQWLATLIGLAALCSFLASRAQIHADRASSFASLRAIGADPGVAKGVVRAELLALIGPGVLVGTVCAFVLALRVVWSGGLGAGARFAIDPLTLIPALVMIIGSLGAGIVLLGRRVTRMSALQGMSTRRVS
jgi:FtsX-like permease family